MHEMILCKLGEVVLKGLNRRSFEDKLQGLGAMIEKVDSDRDLQKFKLRVG